MNQNNKKSRCANKGEAEDEENMMSHLFFSKVDSVSWRRTNVADRHNENTRGEVRASSLPSHHASVKSVHRKPDKITTEDKRKRMF